MTAPPTAARPADAAASPTAFAALLPAGAACVEATPAMWEGGLHEQERAAIARAADKRLREFTAGRNCARAALLQLGVGPLPIGVGAHREPLFPAGISGTITHTDGYCAAAAIRSGAIAALGIDAEQNSPLRAGLLPRIATAGERAALAALGAGSGVCTGRLLFAVKEAFYKAWFQLTARFLGFHGVETRLDTAAGSFSIEVTAADAPREWRGRSFTGRCSWDAGLIRAAAALPAVRGGA